MQTLVRPSLGMNTLSIIPQPWVSKRNFWVPSLASCTRVTWRAPVPWPASASLALKLAGRSVMAERSVWLFW
ncbi:hypothetical protein D3C72_1907880 [compost metagenome]